MFGAALQPDGKIVLVGDADARVAVARLNPNGSLDTSFSRDGKKLFSWGAFSRATAVLVLPTGKLLLGGFSGPEGGNIQVARLNPRGALDATFGSGGKVAVEFGGDDFGHAIARLKPDGSPDAAFDGDGTATLDFGSLADLAFAALLQPDGKIVVAGSTQATGDFAVARLNPDGSPDMTFGAAGKATADFGAAAFAFAMALQPDGRIVVAGQRTGADDFAIARLLG